MNKLVELKKQILEDGVIDASEVRQIKELIFNDGVIDTEEVEFLFDLNDEVSGKANDPSWKELFVEAIASNILEDGEIDHEETQFLLGKIQGDGSVDEVEKALLQHLKANVSNFPEELNQLL